MNGDEAPLGRDWILHFARRNPSVASVIGRKIEALRAEAATADQVRAFLELYDNTQKRYNISVENTYNMDEIGVALHQENLVRSIYGI
jgi:hypothetical protein